uniref:DEP domain-containing protein n=1 Tax=Pyramimonas obovata TaxID=1411642 RepID=A0A7S0N715_9CHLO|mmetsp:Transcript_22182/g.48693  ORF Transcript_22182/g.48693 Transcript_22182/m.48693 type:complete len:230 (+) Transcript_22182:523-1212(+)
MARGVEVADRTHHLNTYDQCFVGSDAVAWLVRAGEAESAEAAVALGRKMLKERIIYHVLNEHDFQDARFFYRFHPALRAEAEGGASTNEAGAESQHGASSASLDGKDLQDGEGKRSFQLATADDAGALSDAELVERAQRMAAGVAAGDHAYRFKTYEECFVGSDAVAWLVRAGEAASEEAAIALGNRMLKAGLMYHVLDEHNFENAHLFYRFHLDRSQPKQLGRKITPT